MICVCSRGSNTKPYGELCTAITSHGQQHTAAAAKSGHCTVPAAAGSVQRRHLCTCKCDHIWYAAAKNGTISGCKSQQNCLGVVYITKGVVYNLLVERKHDLVDAVLRINSDSICFCSAALPVTAVPTTTGVPAPPAPTLYYAVQTANGTEYRPAQQPAATTAPATFTRQVVQYAPATQQTSSSGPTTLRPVIGTPLILGDSTTAAQQSAAAGALAPAPATSLPGSAAAPAQAAAAGSSEAPAEAPAAAGGEAVSVPGAAVPAAGPAAESPAGELARAVADALAPVVEQARADTEAAGAAAPAPADAAGSAAQQPGAAPATEPPVASPVVSILQRDIFP